MDQKNYQKFCKNVQKEMMVKCWDIHPDYDRKKCDLLTKLMLECICQEVKVKKSKGSIL